MQPMNPTLDPTLREGPRPLFISLRMQKCTEPDASLAVPRKSPFCQHSSSKLLRSQGLGRQGMLGDPEQYQVQLNQGNPIQTLEVGWKVT